MQSLSGAPPDFITSAHWALMSAAQALAAVEAAKAEWVIGRAALSVAMQVKVLISNVLQLQCARQRLRSKATPREGRAFLDQDAEGVNGSSDGRRHSRSSPRARAAPA
jgi:hypothetical protein